MNRAPRHKAVVLAVAMTVNPLVTIGGIWLFTRGTLGAVAAIELRMLVWGAVAYSTHHTYPRARPSRYAMSP